MPPLEDLELLTCYANALSNWRYEGYIVFTELALEWITTHLPNHTARGFGRILYEHVTAGGKIDQQKETRPEWNFHDFHFDLRIPIDGENIYVETRLIYDAPYDPDDPIIHVVNIHEV